MVFGRVDIDNANVATSIFYGRAVIVPVHNLFTSSRMISRSPCGSKPNQTCHVDDKP